MWFSCKCCDIFVAKSKTMNRKTSQGETPVFVNLLSDAGFKAVYADPTNKSLLISLLNAVLPDDVRVSDIVEYRDREQPPETVYSKKTILDLVCRDAEGNILGVEVQKKVDSRLFSRCVYYAAGQYHSQLLAGGDYASLHPVFEIAFLAQNYPHESPELWDADHIVSHYTFAEKRTGECPYSTIFIILAEIGRFDKSAEECVTARDRLFYWFRHAAEFTQMPDWLDDPESKALLTATEIAAFTPEKKEIYDQDMKNEHDFEYEKSICYREGLEEGRAEGREEGRAEGRVEGAAEKALSVARSFLAEGIPPETVARCIGLPVEEVKALQEKV